MLDDSRYESLQWDLRRIEDATLDTLKEVLELEHHLNVTTIGSVLETHVSLLVKIGEIQGRLYRIRKLVEVFVEEKEGEKILRKENEE